MTLETSDNNVVSIISESTASCQKYFDILFIQKAFIFSQIATISFFCEDNAYIKAAVYQT